MREMDEMNGVDVPMNYDCNLVFCGRMATQRVRLTFGTWDYRTTMEVDVGGNCLGMSVIDYAVSVAFEELPGGEYAHVEMTRENGDALHCSDDEDRGDDWLKDMLIAAEILSITPKPRPAAEIAKGVAKS